MHPSDLLDQSGLSELSSIDRSLTVHLINFFKSCNLLTHNPPLYSTVVLKLIKVCDQLVKAGSHSSSSSTLMQTPSNSDVSNASPCAPESPGRCRLRWAISDDRPVMKQVAPDDCLILTFINLTQVITIFHIWVSISNQQSATSFRTSSIH